LKTWLSRRRMEDEAATSNKLEVSWEKPTLSGDLMEGFLLPKW